MNKLYQTEYPPFDCLTQADIQVINMKKAADSAHNHRLAALETKKRAEAYEAFAATLDASRRAGRLARGESLTGRPVLWHLNIKDGKLVPSKQDLL